MSYNYPYDMNVNPYLPKPNRNIDWANGMEGAKAFSLKPKESVILMDSESDNVFYIKFCDEIGRCILKRCVYHEEPENMTAQADLSEYVKRSELHTEVEAMINQLLGGSTNEQGTVSTAQRRDTGAGKKDGRTF